MADTADPPTTRAGLFDVQVDLQQISGHRTIARTAEATWAKLFRCAK